MYGDSTVHVSSLPLHLASIDNQNI